jgi:hypothetical protein
MELVVIFVVIFVIYGAGWIWQTVSDILRDISRSNWESRVYGQVASSRSIKKSLGGTDLGKLRQVYQRFGEAYDGQLHDRQLFESPKVSFVFRASRALLSIYESSDQPPQFYTQLTYTIPAGWPHRLEVFPQRFEEKDVKYLNVDDIRIGAPEFDRRFVIKSNDADFARAFLDEKARVSVEELRNQAGNDKILISVNSSRLLVRKASILAEYLDVIRFAELSGQLYDRLFRFWEKASGIEIMEEAESAPGDPVCQVCGAPVPADLRVYCRRCRTPHHRDCWEFNGQCSTYACGEKRNVTKY